MLFATRAVSHPAEHYFLSHQRDNLDFTKLGFANNEWWRLKRFAAHRSCLTRLELAYELADLISALTQKSFLKSFS